MDSLTSGLLEAAGMRAKKNEPRVHDAAETGDRRLAGPVGLCSSCSLRGCSRFLRLKAEQQAIIARLLQKQKPVPERAEIVEAGKPAELYTLYDGWACRYMALPDGRRQIINFLLPGDIIGFDGALFGEVRYSVVMLTSGVLCCFGRQTIGTLLETSPEFGKYLLTSAVAEIRTLEQRIFALGRKSAVEKIAIQLLELYLRLEAINRTVPGSPSCSFPLTQRHLADATGLTPTHVNNTLQQLRGEGIVSLSGRLLTIHDFRRLRALACVHEPALEPSLLL